MIEKDLAVEERKVISQAKEEALRNTLKLQKNAKFEFNDDEEGEINLDGLNPHYYCYEPLEYEGVNEKYGIIFCDVKSVNIHCSLVHILYPLC